ncbi:hypothetical protein [Christiangramia echinicola]|uniref:hypothetical protein n=1 Tax=Christiangramia echinicola TaxID=279359 RepID=UPI00042922BD|nr:hypothetical protein [Christiangramia echinicola]
MALSINENNGIFEVNGNLSASNTYQVRKYFEIILKMKNNIKISLEKLDSMDIASVFELRALMSYAAKHGKIVTFDGARNKKIQGAFLGSGCDLFSFNYFRLSA